MQALVSRELSLWEVCGAEASRGRHAANARHVLRRAVLLGGGLASLLSCVTWASRTRVVGTLTTDPAVRSLALAVMPAVLLTQVLKGLAYPSNAILMSGRDWIASTTSMWLASASLVAMLTYGRSPLRAGLSGLSAYGATAGALRTIWVALGACFAMQVLTALARVSSGRGIWRALRD